MSGHCSCFCIAITCKGGLPATFTIESTMGYGCFFPFFFFWLQSTSQLQLPFTSDILLSLESIHDLLMPKSKSFFFLSLNTSWHVGGGGTTSINNSNLLTFPYLLRWRFLVNPFLFLISPLNLKLMHIS